MLRKTLRGAKLLVLESKDPKPSALRTLDHKQDQGGAEGPGHSSEARRVPAETGMGWEDTWIGTSAASVSPPAFSLPWRFQLQLPR